MAQALNIAAFSLLQSAMPFSRSELRWGFINMAAAITLLSVAMAAIALFFFRRRTRDLTLIYIGVFCVLYAVRLLSHLALFRGLFHQLHRLLGLPGLDHHLHDHSSVRLISLSACR